MIHDLEGDGHRQLRKSHFLWVEQLLFMRSSMPMSAFHITAVWIVPELFVSDSPPWPTRPSTLETALWCETVKFKC